jgi:hypothetical protein
MGNADSKQQAGDYVAPTDLPAGTQEVRLTVYKLPFIGSLLGGYHSGVVVNGCEWSFGGGDAPGSGVYECEPEMNDQYTFKQRVVMGTTDRPAGEIDALLAEMAAQWPQRGYRLLEHNCNHWSTALLMELVGKPTPHFVNKLAEGTAPPCDRQSVPGYMHLRMWRS